MPHVIADSSNGPPAVLGTNSSGKSGAGIEGAGGDGVGVYGHGVSGRGVVAHSDKDYGLRATSVESAGLRASSTKGRGLEGLSTDHEGVVGVSTTGNAVFGLSTGGAGVLGESTDGPGVVGESTQNEGVRGVSHNAHGGVVGINYFVPPPSVPGAPPGPVGNGGWFESTHGEGLRGTSGNPDHGGVVGFNSAGGAAVFGSSDAGRGVWGTSQTLEGVHGDSRSLTAAAITAVQLNTQSTGAALYARHDGKRTAGFFDGNVVITGHIEFSGGDCAEHFEVGGAGSAVDAAAPGTVMVIDSASVLSPSAVAYDKRVAGVVSGAGGFRPGIVLDKQDTPHERRAIALVGKVYCQVDAEYGGIEVGDLLTTSPTPGHAMKAADVSRAFGAVLGKALEPLAAGRGLLPILVALT